MQSSIMTKKTMKMLWKYLNLRRSTDYCFVNNYIDIGLFTWKANIDIQSIFNYYKDVTYTCSYLSKDKDDCSQTMEKVFIEAIDSGKRYEQIKSVAYPYASKRECSI